MIKADRFRISKRNSRTDPAYQKGTGFFLSDPDIERNMIMNTTHEKKAAVKNGVMRMVMVVAAMVIGILVLGLAKG